jgi:hypothetical protein
MFDWQKDLTEMWEVIVGLSTEFNGAIQETAAEFSQAVVTELEQMSTEIKELQEEIFRDGWLEELLESQAQIFNFFDDAENNADWPIYYEPKQAASSTFQPACIGCRNYSGTTFGGNLLVCGFHPYGWAEGTCPDWEQEQPH